MPAIAVVDARPSALCLRSLWRPSDTRVLEDGGVGLLEFAVEIEVAPEQRPGAGGELGMVCPSSIAGGQYWRLPGVIGANRSSARTPLGS